MAKTIYVKGNILITTEDYKYNLDDGCLFTIPEGAEVIEPSTIIDGSPCLVIDNKFPYSIYNTYRATGGLSATVYTSYYYNSYLNEVYQHYKEEKAELEKALDGIENIHIENKTFFYKLMIGNAITILDSFVRDIIVSQVSSSEDNFNSYYTSFYNDLKECKREKYDKMNRGDLERYIIKKLYSDSYSNAKKINAIIKKVTGKGDAVCSGTNIGNYIEERHEVFHKNARKKDGSFKQYSPLDIKRVIEDDDKVVHKILSLMNDETYLTNKR